MKKFFAVIILLGIGCSISPAQCPIDTANTTTGFTPGTPAVVKPGVAYSQTVQVYVPATYDVYTVDSLHIDSITGMPTGITYVFNPATGSVLGGQNGAICYSGTTFDTVGPYPLTFYGAIYTNGGPIPFSYLVTLAPNFGYKFRVETAPTAEFTVDSPVCFGDTIKFIDQTTGYPTHWAWTFEGGTPATSTTEFPLVVYDSAGTYSVRLIGRNSISSDTVTQTITVNAGMTGATVATTPAFGGLSSANGSAIVTAASGGTPPYVYSWSTGAMGDTLANVVTGTYSLSVIDTKGCQYVDDSVNISFVNGILQLSAAQQVKIYPNPATDVLNLVWSQKSNAVISIIDLNGSIISTYVTSGEMNNTYDIHTLAAGTYVLRITDKTSNQQQSVLFSKF